MIRMLGAKNNRQRALLAQGFLVCFFLRKQPRIFCFAQGPSGGSFFLLCWLKAFWWLFFWRKQPRIFCFAQGPSGGSFFLRKQPRMFCRGYRRAWSVEMWSAPKPRQSAKKKTARGSIAKQSARKRPPESHRLTRKAKKKTARGSIAKQSAKKNTRKPSPNSQSPLPVVLCA